jgi:hypothetical protein
MKKQTYRIIFLPLLAGTVFAWLSVASDFVRFFHTEGTIFKIQDCFTPNPVTTPCFYGAIAFLIALIWIIKIGKTEIAKQIKNIKGLLVLLIAGNIFAWSNMTLELVRFYSSKTGESVGCSGLLITNPFLTPCFFGSLIFLLSLVSAIVVFKDLKNSSIPTI